MRDQTICEKSPTSPCRTCNREIGSEKLNCHCHNAFTVNKSSLLRRNKSEEKSGASPSETFTTLTFNHKNTIKNNFQSKSSDSITQYKAKTELKVSNEYSRCNICKNSYSASDISAHEQQCSKVSVLRKLDFKFKK